MTKRTVIVFGCLIKREGEREGYFLDFQPSQKKNKWPEMRINLIISQIYHIKSAFFIFWLFLQQKKLNFFVFFVFFNKFNIIIIFFSNEKK